MLMLNKIRLFTLLLFIPVVLFKFTHSLSEDDINSSISSFSASSSSSSSSSSSASSGNEDEKKPNNVISSLRWNGEGSKEKKKSDKINNNELESEEENDNSAKEDKSEEEDIISDDDWARNNIQELDQILLRQLSLVEPRLSRVKRKGARGGGRSRGGSRSRSRSRSRPSGGYPNQSGGMSYPGSKPKPKANPAPSAPAYPGAAHPPGANPGYNYGATHQAQPPQPGWNVPNTGGGYNPGRSGTYGGGVLGGAGMGTGLGMGAGMMGGQHKSGGLLGSKGKMAAAGILGAAGGYYVGRKMGQIGTLFAMGRHRPYGYYDGYYDRDNRYIRCQEPPKTIKRIEVNNGTVIIDEGQSQYDPRCLYFADEDNQYNRGSHGYKDRSHYHISIAINSQANYLLTCLATLTVLSYNFIHLIINTQATNG